MEIARLEERMNTMQEQYPRALPHISQELADRDAARARRETYILLAILAVSAFGAAVGSWLR